MATQIFEGIFVEIKPEELPEGFDTKIATDWQDILIAKRDKIKERIQTVIPDEATYQERLADVAITEFTDVLNPNYYKTERALRKYRIKVKRGGKSYIDNVASAFAEGGRFEQGVANNINKFKANAMYAWRFVGDKDKIWGCVPMLAFALKGKGKVLEKIKKGGDSISGTPKPMFKVEHVSRVVPALVNVATEGLVMARMGKEAGEDVTSILNDYNAIIEAYIRKYDEGTGTYTASDFLNPELDPSGTYVKLEYDSTADRLKIHVVESTP